MLFHTWQFLFIIACLPSTTKGKSNSVWNFLIGNNDPITLVDFIIFINNTFVPTITTSNDTTSILFKETISFGREIWSYTVYYKFLIVTYRFIIRILISIANTCMYTCMYVQFNGVLPDCSMYMKNKNELWIILLNIAVF